jgi:hypothetical protein
MKEEKLSRRGFLASAGKLAAGATAGAVGLSMVIGSPAEAAETPAWPWPYPGIDPAKAQAAGAELYYKYGCSQGAFEAMIAEMGHPFTTIPAGLARFGRGGIAGWGSHCGALVGATMAIQLVHQDPKIAEPLIKELTGWYTEFHGYGSPLCHPSVTNWAKENGVRTDAKERKDRCSRLTGETAKRAAELLNAQASKAFGPQFGPRWNVVECHSCHGHDGNASIESGVLQDCAPCHGDPHPW